MIYNNEKEFQFSFSVLNGETVRKYKQNEREAAGIRAEINFIEYGLYIYTYILHKLF